MSELTPEQIVKAIAPYIGAPYTFLGRIGYYKVVSGSTIDIWDTGLHKLQLRAISSLTDEEKIAWWKDKWESRHPDTLRDVLDFVNGKIASMELTDELGQYLRSIFIDLPVYSLGGKTLVEAGLAEYKGGEG